MTEDSFLWDRMTIGRSSFGDIAGALDSLDCELCGSHQGWLDIANWSVRHSVFRSVPLQSGCVYFCRGCLRQDGNADLWGAATAIALERCEAHSLAAGVLGLRLPVFVSARPPETREDNLRFRWLEFL